MHAPTGPEAAGHGPPGPVTTVGVPDRPAVAGVGRYVGVVLLGAAGPVARLLAGGWSAWRTAIALVVLAVAITAFLGAGVRRHALVVRAVALCAGAAVLAASLRVGFLVPLGAVVLGTTLAHGVVVAWRPLPGWPQRPTAVAGLAVAPLVLSGISWYRRGSVVAELAFAAVTVLLLELHARAPAVTAAVDRAVGRMAAAVARALAVVLAALGWAVVVLPTWALSRLTRYDALDPGWASVRTAWVAAPSPADGAPGRGGRAGSAGVREVEPTRAVRRRARVRWVPVAAAVVAVVVATGALDGLRSGGSPAAVPAMDLRAAPSGAPRIPDDQVTWMGIPVTEYAHEDEPFAQDLFRELLGSGASPDLILGSRNRDHRGRYVNVVDGRRASWTPPDPTVTVWFFGGSTMYGIGQRDDHTIPSEVARLASRDGVGVRAVNFGVSGDVNWLEALRFAEAIQSDVPRPDLVVFYDGWNDNSLGQARADDGNLDPGELTRLPMSDQERQVERGAHRSDPRPPDGPERQDARIDVAAAQYRKGVATIRSLARAQGVPVVFFWQPFAVLKAPAPADEELYRRVGIDPAWRADEVRIYQAIRQRSGVDPIDVSRVFDDVDRAVYYDQGHTNELGARIVAQELYGHVAPLLRSAASGR